MEHVMLALTNWSAVLAATSAADNITLAMVLSVLLASVLMHLSETKHNMNPGRTWARFSTAFLNLDRFVSIMASIYFARMWWMTPMMTFAPPFLVGFGAIMLAIGERTTDVSKYIITHTWWHLAVFMAMWIVIKDYNREMYCKYI